LFVVFVVCSLIVTIQAKDVVLPAGPRSSASTDYTPFDPSYVLVWSDEFNQTDGSTPDTTIWTHETGGNGNGNNELEYYTDSLSNSFIENGRLVIQGLHEEYMNHNYTSARINTQGKVEVLYGFIAARARITMADGFWPAFWLLGSSISRVNWPRCGEIDIMEQVNGRGTGGQDDSLQFGTLHYNQDGENSTNVNHQQTGATITAKKGQYWGDDFHLYQAIWTSTSFTFLVDDLAYETIDLTKQVSFNSFNDPSNSFFFIVNLALGGNFPKRIPDPNGFPARFELDWIRVWKQEGEGIVHIKQADPASISHEYQEAQQGKVREFQQTQNKATNTNNRHIQQ